ncbi:MAG: hypothetical protein ACOCZ8_07030 [Bacteroidota bacterium]
MKRALHILSATVLAFAMLLVQFPREAVHELVHEHCAHDLHHCEAEAESLKLALDLGGEVHFENYCPLFQDLLLAYAGILSVDALHIDNPEFVSAFATASVAPTAAQVIAATARGPPESC